MTDELRNVSHAPPYDSHNRVQNRYECGPDAIADGGDASGADERTDDAASPAMAEAAVADDGEAQTLTDVDHSPPDGEGTHNVYRRGRTWE